MAACVMARCRGLLRLQGAAAQACTQQRWLNLQEYQSKQLMADGDIAVQRFQVAESVAQAESIAATFRPDEYVIKAQILAGGRGKGTFSNGFRGGVHLTREPAEVAGLVGSMLGHSLVTKQTPAAGVPVRKVMVAQALDIARETYLAIVLDRSHSGPVLVASPEGGVDIEEVAERNPAAIFTEPIDLALGVTDEQAQRMARNLEFEGELIAEAATQIQRLYRLFCRVDATQVEINPFGETPDKQVVCFDAKINFDDNAAFRQKEIFAMEDVEEADPREVAAAADNLNYIGMDGNIGCLVNGAGLAMATMDQIKLCGGEPANFLDVGGGVNEAQVTSAFRLLSADPQVRAILVNVFGGIVNCATVARGITAACQATQLSIPVVVRLEGTNVEEARKILSSAGLALTAASDLQDAAEKAVAALATTAAAQPKAATA